MPLFSKPSTSAANISLSASDVAALSRLAQHEAQNLVSRFGLSPEAAMQSVAMTIDSAINRAAVPGSALYGTKPNQIANNFGSVVQSVMNAPSQYSGFNTSMPKEVSPEVQANVEGYLGMRSLGMQPFGFQDPQAPLTPLDPNETPTLGTHYANLAISQPSWGPMLNDAVKIGSGVVQHVGGWLSTDPAPSAVPSVSVPSDTMTTDTLAAIAPTLEKGNILSKVEAYSPGTFSRPGYGMMPNMAPEDIDPYGPDVTSFATPSSPLPSVGTQPSIAQAVTTSSIGQMEAYDAVQPAPIGQVETAPLEAASAPALATSPITARIDTAFDPFSALGDERLTAPVVAPTVQSVAAPPSMRSFAPPTVAAQPMQAAIPKSIDPAIAAAVQAPPSMRSFAVQPAPPSVPDVQSVPTIEAPSIPAPAPAVSPVNAAFDPFSAATPVQAPGALLAQPAATLADLGPMAVATAPTPGIAAPEAPAVTAQISPNAAVQAAFDPFGTVSPVAQAPAPAPAPVSAPAMPAPGPALEAAVQSPLANIPTPRPAPPAPPQTAPSIPTVSVPGVPAVQPTATVTVGRPTASSIPTVSAPAPTQSSSIFGAGPVPGDPLSGVLAGMARLGGALPGGLSDPYGAGLASDMSALGGAMALGSDSYGSAVSSDPFGGSIGTLGGGWGGWGGGGALGMDGLGGYGTSDPMSDGLGGYGSDPYGGGGAYGEGGDAFGGGGYGDSGAWGGGSVDGSDPLGAGESGAFGEGGHIGAGGYGSGGGWGGGGYGSDAGGYGGGGYGSDSDSDSDSDGTGGW